MLQAAHRKPSRKVDAPFGHAGDGQGNGSRLSGYGVRIIVCVYFFPRCLTSTQDLGMQLELLYPRRTRFAPMV
jgi:hypothetical protein